MMLQQTGDEDGIRHDAVKMATAPAAMMASNFGKLPEFQPDSGNIDVYLERFELFATANDIAEEKKLQLFLTAIGEKAYVTLRSLLLPKMPSKVTFEEATSVLKKHYAPKRSVVTERYRFNQRKQEAHESVTEFVVELKKLAATCEFGAFLEDALRDRLIAGIQADAIRCRLLAMTDAELTWDRACSIATAMETATQDAKKVFTGNNAGRAPGDTEVHWQRQATTSRPAARKAPFNRATPPKPGTRKKGEPKTFHPGSKPCHRCGGPHAPVSCPFLNSTCFKCDKKGHVAKMCKTKEMNQLLNEGSDNELLTICHTDRSSGTPAIVVNVELDGKEVAMELDTGAAMSVMSEAEFATHFPKASFRKANVKLVTYNGTPVPIKGIVDVTVQYHDQSMRLPLVIAKETEGARMPSLFGRNWLEKIKIKWQEVVRVKAVDAEVPLPEKYRDVFAPGYGSIK
ncbi:uncharacterized protein LOC144180699 [Haemaphysalis longicornis]